MSNVINIFIFDIENLIITVAHTVTHRLKINQYKIYVLNL